MSIPSSSSARRPVAGGGPVSPVPPLSGRHPAVVFATLVAAACVLVSVSFVLYETDLWQHLLVGRVIWQTHEVPVRQIWIWPTYGAPDVTPSWGFRALLWPIWSAGGVWGLFAWRWLTTLAAFGVAWMTARRMGVRGLAGLVVVVLASLAYRQRSQVRPETLAAVLLALEIWILETRRQNGPDRSPWLVALAWVWANSHISYVLGLIVLGLYHIGADASGGSGAEARGPRNARAGSWRLVLVGLGMLAVSFLNPHGWSALWQPFDFALFWRKEPIFAAIGELQPVVWTVNWRNGLPLLVFGWPMLILWRWRRGRPDMIEAMLCALFTAMAMDTRRFLGFYAIACVPFAVRDLDDWLSARRLPAWSGRPWARAALVSLLCVGIGLPEWSRGLLPLGIGIDMRRFPVAACDFMAAHGVRGRGFNEFYYGGYMLWRFWPERDRRPFMDIHQSGTAADRRLYGQAMFQRQAWMELDRRHRFDYLLLNRLRLRSQHLLDQVDGDSTWALVFADDAAAVYVRRDGPLTAIADSFAYRRLPAARARLADMAARCRADSGYRAAVRAELERSVADSRFTSGAHGRLADIALIEGRRADARRELALALEGDPLLPAVHERLGRMALEEGRAREALREFRTERSLGPARPGLDLDVGRAYEALGDDGRALAAYRRERKRHPQSAEARAAAEALERRIAR